MFHLRQGFYVMGLVAALTGCGGKSTTIIYVIADGGATGAVTSDASTGAGGSSSKQAPTLAEACQALCDRLARANCLRADCAAGCQKANTNDSCTDAYVKFLTCALEPDFVCDNGVAVLANKACLDEKNAFYQCRTGQTPPTYPPPPDAMDPFPPPDEDAGEPFEAGTPTACPDIPSLPDTATCKGPDPNAGPSDAEVWPVCPRTCVDDLGHEWHSECNGGKCLCSYGGSQRCTCPQKAYLCSPDCCF